MSDPMPLPEEAFCPILSVCPICGDHVGKLTHDGSENGFYRWHTVCNSGDLILLFVGKDDSSIIKSPTQDSTLHRSN